MAARTKMAMSSDFLDAFARLPRPQQRSVRTLISRFNADSTAKGLNYEKITQPAIRPCDRSASIRATGPSCSKPAQGDVHMLLWADKHDAAYALGGTARVSNQPRDRRPAGVRAFRRTDCRDRGPGGRIASHRSRSTTGLRRAA